MHNPKWYALIASIAAAAVVLDRNRTFITTKKQSCNDLREVVLRGFLADWDQFPAASLHEDAPRKKGGGNTELFAANRDCRLMSALRAKGQVFCRRLAAPSVTLTRPKSGEVSACFDGMISLWSFSMELN